ncbi:MAG: hypothetical protein KJ964_07565 [Verrucomicrobia bacterium]|nr:hypothetical protein [Verrucomicrobiota bacterium]MBU1856662.1 hypothetical protein [Verrucomicrobiota bacterium]
MKQALLGIGAALTALAVTGAPSAKAIKTDLPLKQVVLFTSGVAYFERAAEISGTAEAELSFKTDQINDLIKSLVLIDEGDGHITAVTYESRDPVDRTLKSFSVDLTDNPNLGNLLNRLRGVNVRVKATSRDWTGMIVGVEIRKRHVDKEIFEEKFLNLMSDKNVRALSLDAIQEIEVLDPVIQADLDAALKVLAVSHDQGKKTVRLTFSGEKRRLVRAGYMLEAPVWKTSYRLVLDDKGTPFLQGWAHVENMTDDDWSGVTLTLVSGRPLSFIQNLYDPIYLRRPVVRPTLDENLAPPEYEGALDVGSIDAMAADTVGGAEMQKEAAPKGRKSMRMVAASGAVMAAPPRPQINMAAMGGGGVEAMAATREAGELFEYAVKEPITLPRRQSAMIPIVNQTIKGEKLSIFNAQVNPKNPLNGVELENTSGLFLMQGPVTVFEDGMYAGDARLTDTQRGEKRLLAYALDLAGEAKLDRKSEPEEIVSMKITRGTLTLQRKFVDTAVYTLKNKRDKTRQYLIEHPLRPDWELVEPAKGIEKTRDAYRFRLALDGANQRGGGKSRDIIFREQHLEPEIIMLANIQSDQVRFFISQKKISDKLRQALKELVGMQEALYAVRQERLQKEQRVKAIAEEQNRIRPNMQTVTKNSESYSMWERKLVQQEKDLDQLNVDLEKLRADEQSRNATIARFLAELNVE